MCDSRRDFRVPLCWAGLVTLCVSVRACVRVFMAAISAMLAGWYVRDSEARQDSETVDDSPLHTLAGLAFESLYAACECAMGRAWPVGVRCFG